MAIVVTNWEIVERFNTICMEQARKFRKEFICNGSSRWKVFREKSNAFRGITFFPSLPKGPKSPAPFSWITSARLQVERKRKIYRYFVNGTTQSRSCFRCHKKIPVILWRKFFTEISVQMVSAPDFVSKFNLRKEQKTVLCNFKLLKNDRSKLLVMSCIEQILHSKQVHPTTECFKIRQTCLK